MVISTRVYVEHPDLALAHTIRSCPDADLCVVSDKGTDPQHEIYIFRVEAPDFGAVEEALGADHTVANYRAIVEKGDRRTYQIEYSDEAILISPVVTDLGGIVLSTESRSRGWELHLQLHDHRSLFELHEFAESEGITLEVLDVHQSQGAEEDSQFGLTDAQVEALVCAHIHGFYDEPREISLEGLASILGISQTAVSGRLRRGADRLIEEILLEDDREE